MSQVHVSHTQCKHAKTPKERAKCRRARRNGAPEMTKSQVIAKVNKVPAIPAPGSNLVDSLQESFGDAFEVVDVTDVPKKKRSKKRSKVEAEINTLEPGLVETLDTTYAFTCSDPDCEGHVTQDDADEADARLQVNEDSAALTVCEQDEAPEVQVNVIAKGSKVVHKPFLDGAEDGTYLFTCTKRVVNIETATITSNDVTCKNCLKVK